MKKLLALFSILFSAQLLLAGDTPDYKPFPHGHYPVYAAHHYLGYGHTMFHGHGFHFRPLHKPAPVSITVPGTDLADAEMETISKSDMTMISLPSFVAADAEMDLLNQLTVYVDNDYREADAEMEANHRADEVKISIPGFENADDEINAQIR